MGKLPRKGYAHAVDCRNLASGFTSESIATRGAIFIERVLCDSEYEDARLELGVQSLGVLRHLNQIHLFEVYLRELRTVNSVCFVNFCGGLEWVVLVCYEWSGLP